MNKTDITIIIVNFNTAKLVCDCLESIPQGIKKNSYAIIVVDNGSKDNSVQIIRKQFPDITIIENTRNLGFAGANNQALKIADSRYYLLLNSDTIITSEAIDKTIDFMDSTPDCGFASPQLLNKDGSLQNTAANFPTLLTELTNKSLLKIIYPKKFYKKKLQAVQPQEVESLVGAALFARADMCQQIGFYSDDFFFFLEETEWCLRASKNYWKCFLLPNTQIYHLQGQTAKKTPFKIRIEYWRSRYTYFKKSFPKYILILLVIGLLLKNTANIILNFLASPFSSKSQHKFKLGLYILKWHLKGCPANMGISK